MVRHWDTLPSMYETLTSLSNANKKQKSVLITGARHRSFTLIFSFILHSMRFK